MKKNVWAKMLSLALVLVCVIGLAACGGSSSAAGTYRLQTIEMMGLSMNLDQLAEAAGISPEDYKCTLELKSNGNFTLDASSMDDGMSMDGTWKASGSSIELTVDGETITATLNGNVITLSTEGISMTFKK